MKSFLKEKMYMVNHIITSRKPWKPTLLESHRGHLHEVMNCKGSLTGIFCINHTIKICPSKPFLKIYRLQMLCISAPYTCNCPTWVQAEWMYPILTVVDLATGNWKG